MVVVAHSSRELVKENASLRAPLSGAWLLAALAALLAALAAVAHIDHALPAPLGADAPRERFRGLVAHQLLVNLTSIGPRVAGSYENEVLAVSMLVSTIKHIAQHASPHNRIELDVHAGSGAFALSFMDGMSNVYRGVQSVVARVRGAGGRPRDRSALLLNCHFDTVPDSPGASDDGAGCAVLLETMRALAAQPRPLRHDAIFLFNGAEENILQASHAFITQHRWARDVRAFINIEACGAGGREVLFQAGPHDPWIIEMYASEAPHPFASSVAQELFESGLIPADTDFRIFRDFGNLSGVDLAWSANGYVYHTRLDTAARVPAAALQRTGDNVLALARGLLAGGALDAAPERARLPVYFDVLGRVVLCARAPAALLTALAVLALVLLKLRASAEAARGALVASRGGWARAVLRALLLGGAASLAGAGAALLVALALHAAGAPLSFYSRVELLAPLYALPAVAGTWAAAARLWGSPALLRGWWAARAWHDAHAAAAAALLALGAAAGLRSAFLPALWAGAAAGADLAASALRLRPGARAALWAAAAALPAAQTLYLALGSLRMFVPVMGRAGAGALPPDAAMALLVALLTLAATGWLLPLALAARGVARLARGAALLTALAALLALSPLGRPYSAERPQRLMVFHTRRTLHAPLAARDAVEHMYWVPELDANTPRTVLRHVAGAAALEAAACARLLYCGAPYYLPVRTLVPRWLAAPAPAPPRVRLCAGVARRRLNATALELSLRLAGAAHAVVALAPAAGARLAWSSALAAPAEGAGWGGRRTYFVALHAGGRAAGGAWRLRLLLTHEPGLAAPHWADVALAAHAQFGAHKLAPAHAALLARLPDWVAATGWGVDLHLYRV
ncbi:endoplasmic reticulum metallopeptidase 1-like isoform X2 [Helicoverpa zea]|uniref:endoplasmic reticulum metallopeptidase 1-like isoform X2 n=1 Tax=Helicoverpa zea TaxID=7113 RepID=UPI001F57C363|nr:endoplasmic reticulum metallopeptidase 1-like isoform X2 [Helicoverpa zea]